jgi:DNA (cytosine-5)-methyltransferase 1
VRYGSVCSGIEAASAAWHGLGWQAAWFSEIEPFPSAVLAHHYPTVPNLGDMRMIARRVLTGEVEAPDILIGGTPCQAFSIAGLREGLADERGQLTLAYVRLLDAIDYVRERDGRKRAIAGWENVPGVLSSKDNAFGCFLAALAGEDVALEPPGKKWANAGCVFGPTRTVAWRVLDAQYFGVAQRRRRVFVIASARKGFDPVKVLFEFDGLRGDIAPSRETSQDIAGTVTGGARKRGGFSYDDSPMCAGTVTAALGARNGVPDGGDTPGFLQPVVSTLDASYGRLQGCSGQDANHGHTHLVPVMAFGGNNTSGPIDIATARNACASASGRMDFETETFVVEPDRARSVTLRGREGGATAELGDEVAGCLRASSGGGDKPHVLAPMNREPLPFDTTQITSATNRSQPEHGDPCHPLAAGAHPPAIAFDSRQDPVSSEHIFGALGSSSPQAQAVCVTGDITHTLKADGFDASEDGTGRGQPIVAFQDRFRGDDGRGYDRSPPMSVEQVGTLETVKPWNVVSRMRVRRLTPVECERLQGFLDDYTFIPTWNGWRAMDASETPESCIAEGLEIRRTKKTGKWRVKDVDGPRYKALGNSMAVPCMAWLGERIDAATATIGVAT